MSRPLFFVLGILLTALGIVGAFLPLLPTTVFLILAAACFARSSPRLEAWLMNHHRFGSTLRAWRENGAIPRSGKLMACAGMAVGLAAFYAAWATHPHPRLWVAGMVTAIIAACAGYVLTRPET